MDNYSIPSGHFRVYLDCILTANNSQYMLTKRQKQILDYINKYLGVKEYSPTLEEIARHFRLSSVATVHEHIEILKNKGYLKKENNQPRAISPIKNRATITVPLVGVIAAGQPIEAIETSRETITIPKDDIRQTFGHYALRVKGDSMIGDGIFDGDIVIIRSQQTAENGQTVVAITNSGEATLKKIFKEKGIVRLQPANQKFKPLYYKDVEIRGVVRKIIRNLP